MRTRRKRHLTRLARAPREAGHREAHRALLPGGPKDSANRARPPWTPAATCCAVLRTAHDPWVERCAMRRREHGRPSTFARRSWREDRRHVCALRADPTTTGDDRGPQSRILNCTLKKSPEVSNTEALIRKVVDLMTPLGVESEIIRVVDYAIPFGVVSDLGPGDEWPPIYDEAEGRRHRHHRHAHLVRRARLDRPARHRAARRQLQRRRPDTGQFPLYGKVAGVVVTGNEDGAHDAAATTLFNLSHLGCVVPPNVDTYWVGDAGPARATSRPAATGTSTPTRRRATWRTTSSGWRGCFGTTPSRPI